MDKDQNVSVINFPPTTLRESVYTVFAFFDMFDYPLKIEEIKKYLLECETSVEELKSFLDNDSKICSEDGFYFLGGREVLIQIRKKREEIAKKYWNKVKRFGPLLQMVPFIRMVAVCNTLAFNNPKEGSDIDLFIITDKDRIFTARTLSALLYALLGVRRHKDKVAKRFCLSFYISETGMDLRGVSLNPFDIYMIYWIKTLRPIFGEDMLDKFLEQNPKMSNVLIDSGTLEKSKSALRYFGGVQEFFLKRKLGDFIEESIKKSTLRRYERNKAKLDENSSVVVNSKMLKFHNVDKRDEFNNKFVRKYKSLLG